MMVSSFWKNESTYSASKAIPFCVKMHFSKKKQKTLNFQGILAVWSTKKMVMSCGKDVGIMKCIKNGCDE